MVGGAAEQVLEELVHQFADDVACFRELIQNAIDAGTAEVEISFDFTPSGGGEGEGVIVAEVRDWGAGMDREIIDERLTRLFASAKEGDATKIGKFGIGFVSVFALDPAAICVDTGRAGECWRVLFERDRSFRCIRLDEPVEGTRVRLFIDGDADDFKDLRERARHSVAHWCEHVEIELRFDGERIDRPMELEGLLTRRARIGNRLVVVGHPGTAAPEQGFYNGGITLEAGPACVQELAGLSFKVLAGDLEHTLTRDGVVRDEAFEASVGAVLELADGALLDAVIEELSRLQASNADPEAMNPWLEALAFHVERALQRGRITSPLADCVLASSATGRPLEVGELAKVGRKGPIRLAQSPSPAARALDGTRAPVVVVDPRSPDLLRLLRRLGGDRAPVDVDATWVLPEAVDPSQLGSGFDAMSQAMIQLLKASGHKVSSVSLGGFRWPGSRVDERIGLTLDATGTPEQLSEAGDLHAGLLRRRRPLVLNRDHVLVREALALAASEPELAAFMILKSTRLEAGQFDGRLESLWSAECWEQRCRRVAS